MTIDQWVLDGAAKTPEKPAVIFEDTILTYQEFALSVTERARGLQQSGISKGDRVGWYGLNHPEMFVLLFACAQIGAIFVPFNWRLAPDEIAAISDSCTPGIIFYDDEFRDAALSLSGTKACAIGQYPVPRPPVQKTDPATSDDPLLIAYTSGSTGTPKGVVLTQNSLISNAKMSIDAHAMTPSDTILNMLPMFHVGGLNILATPAISIGATILLHRKFEPVAACAALDQVDLGISVPTVLQAMMSCPEWTTSSFSKLRALSIGSTDVPVPLLQAVLDKNIAILQIYGATETSPFAIYQQIDHVRPYVGSIGQVGSDCQARLVTSDGTEAVIGTPGEIWIKGDNVLDRYWNAPEQTSEALVDGWFRTGDIASCDSDGFYWFKDRIKNVIISGGENIYPAEIERVLLNREGTREVSVIGVSDDKWGQIPVAVIVSDIETSLEETRAYLRGKIASYKFPRKVVHVSELPRNVMGKVVPQMLRDAIQDISFKR